MAFGSNQAIWILQLIDRYSTPIKRITNATRTATSSIGRTSAALRKMGYHMTSLRSIISAAYGFKAIKFPIKLAADFEEQMINDLEELIEEAQSYGVYPCESGCPFIGNNIIEHDCMSCYTLFPGYGDLMLDENCQRKPITLKNSSAMSCPCSALGADFVSWRIHKFLKDGKL